MVQIILAKEDTARPKQAEKAPPPRPPPRPPPLAHDADAGGLGRPQEPIFLTPPPPPRTCLKGDASRSRPAGRRPDVEGGGGGGGVGTRRAPAYIPGLFLPPSYRGAIPGGVPVLPRSPSAAAPPPPHARARPRRNGKKAVHFSDEDERWDPSVRDRGNGLSSSSEAEESAPASKGRGQQSRLQGPARPNGDALAASRAPEDDALSLEVMLTSPESSMSTASTSPPLSSVGGSLPGGPHGERPSPPPPPSRPPLLASLPSLPAASEASSCDLIVSHFRESINVDILTLLNDLWGAIQNVAISVSMVTGSLAAGSCGAARVRFIIIFFLLLLFYFVNIITFFYHYPHHYRY